MLVGVVVVVVVVAVVVVDVVKSAAKSEWNHETVASDQHVIASTLVTRPRVESVPPGKKNAPPKRKRKRANQTEFSDSSR